jgi:hypothetical protein
MAKRKRTKGQITIYKTLHRKTKDRITRTTGEVKCELGQTRPTDRQTGRQTDRPDVLNY